MISYIPSEITFILDDNILTLAEKISNGIDNYLMENKDKKALRREGQVIESLPSTHFRIKLDDGQEILAHLAGKLRLHRIRILLGDRVTVEISPYDDKKGRIVYRGK